MQNPFRVMADEAGSVRELTELLYPLSYTTVYRYVRGYQVRFGHKMRQVLILNYGADRAELVEQQYCVWRGERAKKAIDALKRRNDEGESSHFG